jgi:hypothetical protein
VAKSSCPASPRRPTRIGWRYFGSSPLLEKRTAAESLLLVCLGAVLHTSLCLSPNINIPPSSHSLTDPFLELSCFVVVAVVAILPLRPITPRLDKFTAPSLTASDPSQTPSLFLNQQTRSLEAQSLIYCNDFKISSRSTTLLTVKIDSLSLDYAHIPTPLPFLRQPSACAQVQHEQSARFVNTTLSIQAH